MSVNDPIWIEGEVKLINASGASLDGLWIEGEITLYGEAAGQPFIKRWGGVPGMQVLTRSVW